MALTTWYRKKLKDGSVKEFNGKYVVEVDYYADNRLRESTEKNVYTESHLLF